MNRRQWLALAVLALALTACGSSDSSDSGSSGSTDTGASATRSTDTGASGSSSTGSGGSTGKLSKAELTAKADEICKDVNTRLQAVPRYKSLLKDYPGVERYGTEFARVIDEGASKFKELTPPDSLKSDYAAFLKEIEDRVDSFRRFAAAGRAKSTDQIVAARTEKRRLSSKGPRLARKMGFKVCGGGS